MSQELDTLPSRVMHLERVIRTLHDTILAPLVDRLAALESHILPAGKLEPVHARIARLDRIALGYSDILVETQDRLDALEARGTPAQDPPAAPEPVTGMPAIGARVRMITPMLGYNDPPTGAIGIVRAIVPHWTGPRLDCTWDVGGAPNYAYTLPDQIEILPAEPPAPTPAPPCWSCVPPTEPGLYWSRWPCAADPEILQLWPHGCWGSHGVNSRYAVAAHSLAHDREFWPVPLTPPA